MDDIFIIVIVILGAVASLALLFGEVLPGKCSPSGQGPPSHTAGAEAEAAGIDSTCLPS